MSFSRFAGLLWLAGSLLAMARPLTSVGSAVNLSILITVYESRCRDDLRAPSGCAEQTDKNVDDLALEILGVESGVGMDVCRFTVDGQADNGLYSGVAGGRSTDIDGADWIQRENPAGRAATSRRSLAINSRRARVIAPAARAETDACVFRSAQLNRHVAQHVDQPDLNAEAGRVPP